MQCIQEVKSLQDELYILTDKDVSNETLKKMTLCKDDRSLDITVVLQQQQKGMKSLQDELYILTDKDVSNETLKKMTLCKDDRSLDITVVLQQQQKGTSDCGLFCIANSVALANGIDPSTVSWDQNKMRDHLYKCFEQGD